MTIALIATAVIIAALYLGWEYHQAPLLDENERPVVPKPRDPVDVIAFHSPAKDRIAERIAANNADRLAAETENYLALWAEES